MRSQVAALKMKKPQVTCVTWGFSYLAEAVRFELTEGSHPRRFSRPVHSTALPSFLIEIRKDCNSSLAYFQHRASDKNKDCKSLKKSKPRSVGTTR
jgi:hypothetical protein